MVKQERLDKLLDATIKNYFEDANVDNEIGIYDTMFDHLLNGDLDNMFLSPKLEDKDYSIRKEAFDLARKYGHLCFYEGNPTQWMDSVQNISAYEKGLKDFAAKEILDNYNFLVELALEKGEDALKELTIFKNSDMATESAVVEYLRTTFFNDDALKMCLAETGREGGMYSDLDNNYKCILYTYPEGVLYLENGGELKMNSEENLLASLAEILEDSSLNDYSSLQSAVPYIGDYYFDLGIIQVWNNYDENKKRGVLRENNLITK